MIDEHIAYGDIATIHPRKQVENREIAAVVVHNLLYEATLKRIKRTRTELMLEAANQAYPPLVFKGPRRKQVSVLGKLVGVVRRV